MTPSDFLPKHVNAEKILANRKKNRIPPLARLRSVEIAAEVDTGIVQPTFLEIGTFIAEGSRQVVEALNELDKQCLFYSVDLNQEAYDFIRSKNQGWRPSDHFAEKIDPLQGPCTAQFIESSSHDAHFYFDDHSIVWCFIDGCHCYECCAKDIELYVPKIVKGGILLIDDTNDDGYAMQKSQWYHDKANPRQYGVLKAIAESALIQNDFERICHVTEHRGLMIWRKK